MSSSETKRLRGQPSKYRPEYCNRLIKHMAEGFVFETFAAEIGVNRDTIYEWCRVHAAFSDAKKAGRELSYRWWMNVMRGNAVGKLKGNASSAIFVMKNCFGWRDTQAIEHSGPGGGPIQNHNLTEQEIKERAKAGLERLLRDLDP